MKLKQLFHFLFILELSLDMESSQSSQSSGEGGGRRNKCFKSHLTMGKKRRKHVSAEKEINLFADQSSLKTSTQVTPIKTFSSGNQTTNITKSAGTMTQNEFSPISTSCQTDTSIVTNVSHLPQSIETLISNGMLNSLCDILSQYNQVEDFKNLLEGVASGKIAPDNICWLLNVHLGRLSGLTNTSQMHWHKDIVDFFSIVYILFGASAINVLCGPMHFSEVVMEKIDNRKFDPHTAKINLPIPSVTTLRSTSTGYQKEIPVGLVEHTLDMAEVASQKGSQYVLSFDGKLVAKGFKGESYGDINLWGIEKPISVANAIRLLKHSIKTTEMICTSLKSGKILELV